MLGNAEGIMGLTITKALYLLHLLKFEFSVNIFTFRLPGMLQWEETPMTVKSLEGTRSQGNVPQREALFCTLENDLFSRSHIILLFLSNVS